jgi:uncharacterized protein YuzE
MTSLGLPSQRIIEFKAAQVAEPNDLDENTVLDLDQSGNISGLTIEHTRVSAQDIPPFSYEQVAVHCPCV